MYTSACTRDIGPVNLTAWRAPTVEAGCERGMGRRHGKTAPGGPSPRFSQTGRLTHSCVCEGLFTQLCPLAASPAQLELVLPNPSLLSPETPAPRTRENDQDRLSPGHGLLCEGHS